MCWSHSSNRTARLTPAQISALVAGTTDLTNDLRATHVPNRYPLLHSLSRIVLAARAAGVAALDGVHLSVRDLEAFRRECVQGRELGFDGKTLIHPATVDIANEEFGPSERDIAWASRVIDAYNRAKDQGQGVAEVDGKLIETMHVTDAHRVLQVAAAISNHLDRQEGVAHE